jgi:inhibitor of cysteine peptidase
MRRALARAGMLSLLFLNILGCAAPPAAVVAPEIKQYSNPAQRIMVAPGDQFEISLDANETTGYSWKGNEVYDKEMLQLVKSQYVTGQTDRVGAGGKQVYLFKALKSGNTQITLTYKRSWEKTEYDKTVSFNVSIK